MDTNNNQQKANQWVNDYADSLYKYALQRVRDIHAAKDLVQETFLGAWRNMDKYNGEASEKTWLFVILKNKIIDYYRKTSKRLTQELIVETTYTGIYFDAKDHWTKEANPLEWNINYDTTIETKEFYVVLESCKKKLKELQRIVFTMKYLDGFESEEICAELELSSANYWVLIHRAKVQLRACLETNWFLI